MATRHGGRRLRRFLLERYDGWVGAEATESSPSLSLSSSECEPLSLRDLLKHADDEGMERWDRLSLGYVDPSSGSEYLRHEILRAQFDEIDDPVHVNVCAPQEGISLAVQALCSPGDYVVVTAPSYQSLSEMARSIGCEVDEWWPEGICAGGVPHFNTATLRNLVKPNKTRLVICNFPHNPTGALPTPDEFNEIMSCIKESNNTWLLMDEMYRGLEHSGKATLPAAADVLDRAVSLGGLSKTYGLPGLRLGWLVNRNESFMNRVAELKDYTTICPPAPSEALGFIALRAKDDILARSRSIVSSGLTSLRRFVTERDDLKDNFEWCEPSGGTFAWVGLVPAQKGRIKATEYCKQLRQRTGLMIVPSGLFVECTESDNRIRLTYGRAGIDRLLGIWGTDMKEVGFSNS